MGGRAAIAQDGTTSLPPSVRHAALQTAIFAATANSITTLRNLMRPFRSSEKGGYPADAELNHIAPNVMGPLRHDWTVGCPTNISKEEQATQCVSIEETVWGAETLAKLSDFKGQIDPKGLFDCYLCVNSRTAH